MSIRMKILPKTISDGFSMVFILIIIPLLYWFELWIVLPNLYKQNTIPYFIHFTIGNFLMLNIVGNLTYTVLCDTTIRGCMIPVSVADTKNGWRLCTICESLTPPRSWHCSTCDVCILKRDHHCIFTGCCVGHFNHRYFIMFLFYIFIATIYAFIYNNIFIWTRISFEFPMSIIKLVFPLAIFVFGFDGSIEQFYLLLYIVSLMGMLFTGALCLYHFNLIFNGTVANESNKKNYKYNLGWKENLKEVLGEKWYLAWLLPYIKSELPHNGVTWDTFDSWKVNKPKNR